ncbi:MAG: radical SAM family heme chaperone HemW [Cyanobacteriota bacterium]|jgi:oxygen-independent coproporphyrinogen-3 oxidase
MEPRSAYLHLPFCHRRCFYCDFPVVPLGDRADGASSGSIAAYLELLHGEIHATAIAAPGAPPLSTVYFGGGTPSMLTPPQVAALLATLRHAFGLAPGAEISFELDPASFDQPRLAGYLEAGINRVSLGGQSFDDDVLEALGRRHRATQLLEATHWLAQAQRRGDLASWSLDLIQGLPGQSAAHWRQQLDRAIATGAPHLSVYDLIVEPGTVFARRQQRGDLPLPDDDLSADLMELTWQQLVAAGYGHYEISNYALPGHASRHNRVYWSGAGWWGFGMGATSAPYGRRLARPRTREGYARWLEEGMPAPAGEGGEDRQGEAGGMPADELLLVGLRRREGVNLSGLAARHGLRREQLVALRRHLAAWEARGLLEVVGPRWRLSDPAGLALSNGVLRELLDWWQANAGP